MANVIKVNKTTMMQEDVWVDTSGGIGGNGPVCGDGTFIYSVAALPPMIPAQNDIVKLLPTWAPVAPTVTSDPVTTLGVQQATLNGTLVDDGGVPCDCGFEWGKSIGYGASTPNQTKTMGESFSQPIAPLEPSTEYHYRAFARNIAGIAFGADIMIRTYPAMGRGYALSREEL